MRLVLGPLLGLLIDAFLGVTILRRTRGNAMRETRIGNYLYPLHAIGVAVLVGGLSAVAAVLAVLP